MEGQMRHLINGNVVEEPGGWDAFTEDIKRDAEERLIYLAYPNSLTFNGGGYSTLRTLFIESYCTQVPYTCEQNCNGAWLKVFDGVIILSDITWNLSKCTAEAPITDTTVGALILNNKDIQVFPTATLTKNGEALTAVPAIPLEVFDPQDPVGTYDATPRNAYDWKACMAHLLSFISDGAITFVSGWYDDLPDDERMALVWGVHLRTAGIDNRAPSYTFDDLFSFAWKADNLVAGVLVDGPDITFRLETADYWNGVDGTWVMLHQEDLEQTIDTGMLYGRVKMGSEGAIRNEANENPPYSLPFVGLRTFSDEEYTLEGQCNTNNALDLSLPFVVCSNAIEDSVVAGNDENDDQVFVIQYDRTTDQATKGDYLTNQGGPYLYNERLLNLSIVNRWRLRANGVTYFDDITASFLAEYTGAPLPQSFAITNGLGTTQFDARFTFDNDYTPPNFDTSNAWGNGTAPGTPVTNADSRYTAPAQGFYSFEIGQRIRVSEFTNPWTQQDQRRLYVFPSVIVKHYNAANVLQATLINTVQEVPLQPFATGVLQPLTATGDYMQVSTIELYLQPTDYIEVWFKGETWIQLNAPTLAAAQFPVAATPVSRTVTYEFMPDSYVKTNFVASFGGQVVQGDPDGYFATNLTFERHIDNQSWTRVKTEFQEAIRVAHDGDTVRRGYVQEASRTIATGNTQWTLICNRQQTNV